jgi:hypothetical protein
MLVAHVTLGLPIQFLAESKGLKPKQVGRALKRAAEKIRNPPLETGNIIDLLTSEGL